MEDQPAATTRFAIATYRVERLLGSGGQADVFLACDEQLERPVALKLLSADLAADERFRERFLQESRLAASLDHPNVIPIYEAGDADGHLYIAMRYVEGTDLRRILDAEGALPPGRALELLAPVADALDAAHARGLVHRDVKPSNVLVAVEPSDGSEHVYLADFGLSRYATEREFDTRFTGSAHYAAPELVLRRDIDARADLYALGCVLVESLTGSPPFTGKLMEVLWGHVDGEPPAPTSRDPGLPAAIDAVVARALAKEPDERQATCGELCREARTALGLEEHRLSRRALLVGGASAAVAVAAAAAVPAILLGRGSDRSAAPKGPPPVLPLAGDAVVRLDSDGRLVTAVPVENAGGPLAFGDGAVWLADQSRKIVSRIDPRTNEVSEEIDVAGAFTPAFLAVGEGKLWLANNSAPAAPHVWRLDLAGGELTGVDTPSAPDGLAIAAGSVWVTCGEFFEIDPEAGLHVATLAPLGGGQGDLIAAGEGAVWFAGTQETLATSGGRVWRLDPEARELVTALDFDSSIADIAVGEDAVWIVTFEDDLVLRVDSATNEAADAFRVGRIPEELAAGVGAVWVTGSRDGTVTRYDPVSADVTTIDVGGTPGDIAVGGGAVWVAVGVA